MVSGTKQTLDFYENVGWTEVRGRLVDEEIFGTTEDGPIRMRMYARQLARIRSALRSAGSRLDLLECGCGGTPEVRLLEAGDRYTGVDFSPLSLTHARERLEECWAGEARLKEADVCQLPFRTGEFDAVYSAHVLYHIAEPAAQERALDEMARVLKPGGVLVLNLANPRPLFFPVRLLNRVAADSPLMKLVPDRLRRRAPLPYRPMPIEWYVRQLLTHGRVDVIASQMASLWFNRRVTEHRIPGKALWRMLDLVDQNAPHLAAYLGNYVLISMYKPNLTMITANRGMAGASPSLEHFEEIAERKNRVA